MPGEPPAAAITRRGAGTEFRQHSSTMVLGLSEAQTPACVLPGRRLLRLAAEPSIEHTAAVRTHRSSLVHRRVRGPPESIHCEDK